MPPRISTLLRSTVLAGGLLLPTLAFAQASPPAVSTAAAAIDPAKVVARVDGDPITEGDLAAASEDPALALPGTDEKQKRELLIGYVIDLKLGAKAAEAAKLGDTPEFKKKIAYLRDKLLVDEYLERETQKANTPAAARKLYDETVTSMPPEEEVRARHILVDGEDEAKAIAARLKGGEDFAKIAAETSKDPGSKAEGGELGFFAKASMVAPFADAAFKLKANEISEPVKTQFGWHVIQVEEKRQKPVPAFEEMKEQIDQFITRKAQQDVVLALRKGGKVERLDAPADAAPAEAKKP